MKSRFAPAALCVLLALAARPLLAGFSGTDVVIPAIARKDGVAPSKFYSTVWITNLSESQPAHVDYFFYEQGKSNTSPLHRTETLAAGETKRYENAVETLLGLPDAAGALRIVSDQPVLASSRTYDQPPGTDISFVKGLFFGAIPVDFAIGQGEVARLQGIIQGGGESYRYNFGFVEVGGGSARIRTIVRGQNGATLGTLEEDIAPYGAFQHSINDVVSNPGNARLESTVISGSGRILLYGTLIANGSQDSAGFEMSFKDGLLVSRAQISSENVTASASTTAVWAIQRAYELAPLLGAGGSGVKSPLAVPFNASYDTATGTWTVAVALETGQRATLLIQFRDGQGQVQRTFNLQTASILLKGNASGTQGYLDFDLSLTDIRTGVAFTANGTGTATYQGVSGAVTVTNLAVPKVLPPYPTSGTVVVASNGITITVTFDGTQYAEGTYQYRNQTIHFTIDLKTGEVTVG